MDPVPVGPPCLKTFLPPVPWTVPGPWAPFGNHLQPDGLHAESVCTFLLLAEKYICYAEQTRAVLAKLADHGKKMFLITNSPSSFV